MDGKQTPPDYGYPDDDGGERPPFVLIDPKAYFADRHNGTTAVCDMNGPDLKGQLQVTFCTVAPPLVSYFCVHATHMNRTEFAMDPHILATETDGGLVLLCIFHGDNPAFYYNPRRRHYFVYDALARKLHHLPQPGPQKQINQFSLAVMRKCKKHPKGKGRGTGNDNLTLNPHHFTLRPHGHGETEPHDCRSCSFIVAAQAHQFVGLEHPEICIYQSDTGTWSKKTVMLGSCQDRHFTTKTLTIGGTKGTVAWVDPWCNIFFCDVLVKHPKLSCLKLPPPIRPVDTEGFGPGPARPVRDLALIGKSIKYVEMLVRPDSNSSKTPCYRWEVVVWTIKKTLRPLAKDWQMVYKLDSADIKVDAGNTSAFPTLSTLHVGLPTLSLQNDSIVYFLAKINYRKTKHPAWVLAVDMKTKTVKQVGEWGAVRTIGLDKDYDASRISAYLQPTPGVPLLKLPSKKIVEMMTKGGGAEIPKQEDTGNDDAMDIA